ncbi:MAG: hypothetical protein ACTSSA_07145 [Candidatus Freyarchaeota archaeon]
MENEIEREVRRSHADWEFVKRQPPRIRAALELYIEKGDIRLAQRIAGMDLEDFLDLLREAKIPKVTVIWEE